MHLILKTNTFHRFGKLRLRDRDLSLLRLVMKIWATKMKSSESIHVTIAYFTGAIDVL